MTRISKIEMFHVEVPLPQKEFLPAWYPGYKQTHNRMTLIRLTTDDGLEGISAGLARGREREGLGPWVGAAFLGIDPLDLEKVHQRLAEFGFWGWRNDWIEPAFWDLRGKIEEKPIYQLLEPKVGVVLDVPVYCSLGEIRTLEERRRDLDHILQMGFRAAKIRVHQSLREDVVMVEQVRALLGEGISLMVDVDQGRLAWVEPHQPAKWKLPQALDFVRAVEPFHLEWIEEPLDLHYYDDYAVLRSETEIPIAAGEMNAGWYEFKVFFEKRSLDIYQPDATVAGGVSAAAQVMDACLRRDLHFSPHNWSNGIAFLINLQIYAAWPHKFFLEYPYEPGVWTPDVRDAVLEEPLWVTPEGTIRVPQEPGFGIHLNEEALEKYGTRFYCAEE